MSLTYYRIKHPKLKDLNIFICELETEIDDSIIQKSVNYLQNYIIRKQYVEHENIAMYVSYINIILKLLNLYLQLIIKKYLINIIIN